MIFLVKHRDETEDLEELDDLQSKVNQIRLFEKLGKQSFHYDVNEKQKLMLGHIVYKAAT